MEAGRAGTESQFSILFFPNPSNFATGETNAYFPVTAYNSDSISNRWLWLTVSEGEVRLGFRIYLSNS
ncbi:hypothetical protein PIB30_114663, partial [Stylosanthes scabra]|nr:hypothetical protein [Stylosanthes scabra]